MELLTNAMLTTKDNPFNPYTEWKAWFGFDRDNGYNTCQLLARLTDLVDDHGEPLESVLLGEAMASLVDDEFFSHYTLVYPSKIPEELLKGDD